MIDIDYWEARGEVEVPLKTIDVLTGAQIYIEENEPLETPSEESVMVEDNDLIYSFGSTTGQREESEIHV